MKGKKIYLKSTILCLMNIKIFSSKMIISLSLLKFWNNANLLQAFQVPPSVLRRRNFLEIVLISKHWYFNLHHILIWGIKRLPYAKLRNNMLKNFQKLPTNFEGTFLKFLFWIPKQLKLWLKAEQSTHTYHSLRKIQKIWTTFWQNCSTNQMMMEFMGLLS